MSEQFRYGVIGTGMMGVEHIMNINHIDGAAVTAYADPYEPSRANAASITAGAVGFADYRELLESDLVDAVVIVTPNHTHVDVLADVLATELQPGLDHDLRQVAALAGVVAAQLANLFPAPAVRSDEPESTPAPQ